MQAAVSLQYFPSNCGGEPITVHVSTDPELMRLFRRHVLGEAKHRCEDAGGDELAQVIEGAEEQRLRRVLDLLVPEDGKS